MAEDAFERLNERVRRQLEEILSSNGEQLAISILEKYREIMDAIASRQAAILLRDPTFRELIFAWRSVLNDFPVDRSNEVLLGVIFATLYERTKQ